MESDFVSVEAVTRNATGVGQSTSTIVDTAGLEAALRLQVKGEVRFDAASRALYATDASNYRMPPIGIVIPWDKQDVIGTVAACREFGVPILARGGGTSLAGQCCNVAIVLDFSKYMNRIIEINREEKWARVQPGVVLDELRKAAAKLGLNFGPDPATHSHCTLGGMIGNNSCGAHSILAGKTVDNVHELEVLTYDGVCITVGQPDAGELKRLSSEPGRVGGIYRSLVQLRDRYAVEIRRKYPPIPRRVSGYNLDDLLPENGFHVARALVGSESTCVVVLEAKLRLIDNPPARTVLVLGYPDIFSAADHVPQVMESKPIACEAIDGKLVGYIKRKDVHIGGVDLLPEGGGFLLVEFGGASKDDTHAQAERLMERLKAASDTPSMKVCADRKEEQLVWEVRESGLGATAFPRGETPAWSGWEDAAVAPEKLGRYLRDFRRLLDKYQYQGALYGHFGHGCVHVRINFDLTNLAGVSKYRAFMQEAADLVVGYGGSLSGEHGDGQSRAELLPRMFGSKLIEAFREFKRIWDPDGRMNPGKVVDPNRLDENLRLGPDHRPWQPETHFKFLEEGGFSGATMRCVGVGSCRRRDSKTMCPSYRVTGEEAHSTRGRAHLLFEMLAGEVVRDGWRDEAVKAALDLCLACKGCKGDCPTSVDMATYKAEFLSHYYAGRPRPLHAYLFGNIDIWARLASHVPGLLNLVTQTPGLNMLAKLAGGIPIERTIPAFAPQTFQAWFSRRTVVNVGKPRVLLWPDTFNNYFTPETLQAAVKVLEHLGFLVVLPRSKLCCGRPLYDFGMLERAKRLLQNVMSKLESAIDDGTPLIALEPSCASVFRDELCNLFPADARASRLREQTYLLSEFLQKFAADTDLPRLKRAALVHGHCHQKAMKKMDSEEAVLRRVGVEVTMPDNGCCGMAGPFGFNADKYEVSIAVGERELLPRVRKASPETIVLADGFSCREQIAQTTDRHALHLAEVLQMAIGDDAAGVAGIPERSTVEQRKASVRRSMIRAAAALAGVAAAGFGLWLRRKR